MIQSKFLHVLLLAAVLLSAGACGDDAGGGADAAPADANGQAVAIRFAAKVGDLDAACGGAVYTDLGTAGASVTINDFRFYVSNLRLRSGTDEVPVALDQDGTWQYMDVALLDFEDGTAGCATGGNSATNDTVRGTVPPGSYDGIAFDLGVPYELNHQELTALPSPLNVAAMYWAWALGHKFLRVDLSVQGGGAWNVHLGSTECDSPSPPSAPPANGCNKPNRPRITLAGFDPARDTIVLDLARLVEQSDLSANAGSAPGCQSFPSDADDCTPLFPSLGLDFGTGDCVDGCAGQRAFRVE
jgi:uncharacterized repeat protein (TIGR04052 family)